MIERCTIELHNADCMEIMARYPDGYFDLAIVDPPYGIGESGAKNHTRGKLATSKNYKPFAGCDKTPPPKKYFTELKRVSVNSVIWGANHFANMFDAHSSCWVVWDKENGGSDFADCELAYTSFCSAVRIFRYKWNGMLQGNMSNKEHRIHPTQKPVELYKWLYANYAKPGMKILDTHLGSGSNAIAAYDVDMALFVGCELDTDYYTAAKARIDQHCNQQRLF